MKTTKIGLLCLGTISLAIGTFYLFSKANNIRILAGSGSYSFSSFLQAASLLNLTPQTSHELLTLFSFPNKLHLFW